MESLYREEKYLSIVNAHNLRRFIEKKDLKLWKIFIGAATKLEYADTGVEVASDISKEEEKALCDYVREPDSNRKEFCLLANWIRKRCGDDNRLAYVFYHMGVKRGGSTDKVQCCKRALGFAAKYFPDAFDELWKKYQDQYVKEDMMETCLFELFDSKQFEKVITISNCRPKKVKDYSRFAAYGEYTQRILEPDKNYVFSSLGNITEERKSRITAIYFNALLEQERYEEFCEAFYVFSKNPDSYVSKVVLDTYIKCNKNCIEKNIETMLNVDEVVTVKSWFTMNYLMEAGVRASLEENWLAKKQQYHDDLLQQIESTTDSSEKNTLLKAFGVFFPQENRFVEDMVQELIERLENAEEKEKRGIVKELDEVNNLVLLSKLYEQTGVHYINNPAILGHISAYYQDIDNLQLAVMTKFEQIKREKVASKREINCIELIDLLAEGYLRINKVHLESDVAMGILNLSNFYKIEEEYLDKYLITTIGLSFDAQMPIIAALCYSIWNSVELGKYNLFQDETKNKLDIYWKSCKKRNDMANIEVIFVHLLEVESISNIMLACRLVGKALIYDKFDKKITNHKSRLKDEKYFEEITKYCICFYTKSGGWDTYKKYALETKRYAVYYTVNLIKIYQFPNEKTNEEDDAEVNCIKAHNRWWRTQYPRNVLINNIFLLERDKVTPEYWKTFASCIRKNDFYELFSDNLVQKYYFAIIKNKWIEDEKCKLLLTILEKSRNLKTFFDVYMKNSEKIEDALLRDPSYALKLFVIFICDKEWGRKQVYKEKMVQLREKLDMSVLIDSDLSVLRWIDYLYALRNEKKQDENFFRASFEILVRYTNVTLEEKERNKKIEIPTEITNKYIYIKNENISPDYTLLNYWIDTFGGDIDVQLNTYKFLLSKKLPDEHSKQAILYNLMLSIVRRILASEEALEGRLGLSVLRICKNYLALIYLTGDEIGFKKYQGQVSSVLKKDTDLHYFALYDNALNQFWNSDVPDSLKAKTIFAGMALYWNRYVIELAENLEQTLKYKDEVNCYVEALDYRNFRGSLLRMYLYLWDRNHAVFDENEDTLDVEAFKEMVEAIYPAFGDIIKLISEESDHALQGEKMKALKEMLSEKGWRKLLDLIPRISSKWHSQIVIPCFIGLQYAEDVVNLLEEWAFEKNDLFLSFIKDERIQKCIGVFYTNYYTAVYYGVDKQYKDANIYINALEEVPAYMENAVNALRDSIDNQTEIKRFVGSIEAQNYVKLPEIPSFMKVSNPEGITFGQLTMDFYDTSANVDAATKCKWAQKIYYYLSDNNKLSDVYGFIFTWGFYAIEAEYDVEKKTQILFDLLDYLHLIKDNEKQYKQEIISKVIHVLNAYDFATFDRCLEKIQSYIGLLKDTFSELEELEEYVTLIYLMADLKQLVKENADESDVERLSVKVEYISIKTVGMYFAKKCSDFAKRYVKIRKSNGIFEANILNELFTDKLYYQIKNNGIDTMRNIKVSISIEGYNDDTVESMYIQNPTEGYVIRPDQVFAGEYPSDNIENVCAEKIKSVIESLADGDQITFNITLTKINENEEEGEQLYSRKEVLTVFHEDKKTEPYKLQTTYLETTIDEENISKYYLERESELDEIKNALNSGGNMVLYGTNGTGKSSILVDLEENIIPVFCEIKKPIVMKIDSTKCNDEIKLRDAHINIIKKVLRKFEIRNWLDESDEEERIELVSGFENDSIMELYGCLNNILKNHKTTLYIIWDNFEQVISSNAIDSKNMSYIKNMNYGFIKFIYVGSNYLLEAISNKSGDINWTNIFARGMTRVKIGNLKKADFIKYMKQIENETLYYSDEALEYLWNYTNGHVYYSCVLGNQTISILRARECGKRRKCIYPSDIAIAIYKQYKGDANIESKKNEETIRSQIFQDIENDFSVKALGKILAEVMVQKGVDYMTSYELEGKFMDSYGDIYENAKIEFTRALEVLLARDFFREMDEKEVKTYAFTSNLYFERFYKETLPELTDKEKKKPEITWEQVYAFLDMIPEEKYEYYKQKVPTWLSGNTTQNIGVQIGSGGNANINQAREIYQAEQIIVNNVQYIKNALIETDPEKAYKLLPKKDVFDLKGEWIDEDSLIKAYTQAIAEEKSMESIKEVKGLKKSVLKEAINDIKEKVGESYAKQFEFATKLHGVFDRFIDVDEVDYSPVVLMYSKVVEAILKEKHTQLYSEKFGSIKIAKRSSITFEKLDKNREERIDQNTLSLTIGSYSSPLLIPGKEDYEHPNVNDDVIDTAFEEEDNRDIWKEHAVDLEKIRILRNDSAHKETPMKKEKLEDLMKMLFDGRELNRLINIEKYKD